MWGKKKVDTSADGLVEANLRAFSTRAKPEWNTRLPDEVANSLFIIERVKSYYEIGKLKKLKEDLKKKEESIKESQL